MRLDVGFGFIVYNNVRGLQKGFLSLSGSRKRKLTERSLKGALNGHHCQGIVGWLCGNMALVVGVVSS